MLSAIFNGAPIHLDAFPSIAEVKLSVDIAQQSQLRAHVLQKAARQGEAAEVHVASLEGWKRPLEPGCSACKVRGQGRTGKHHNVACERKFREWLVAYHSRGFPESAEVGLSTDVDDDDRPLQQAARQGEAAVVRAQILKGQKRSVDLGCAACACHGQGPQCRRSNVAVDSD
jgi:hypothetical protein